MPSELHAAQNLPHLDLFNLTLVAGKMYDDIDTATACLVNEILVSTLAFEKPEDILGRNISIHTSSLEKEINPVVLFSHPSSYYTLSIHLKPGEFNNTVKKIERL